MDRIATEQSIRICLTRTHKLLKDAERISKAAVACADAGSVSEGTMVSEDLGQLLHDAGHIHDAASLFEQTGRRVRKRSMKGRIAIDQAALQVAIHTHLVEIRKRLDDAATIARSRGVCDIGKH